MNRLRRKPLSYAILILLIGIFLALIIHHPFQPGISHAEQFRRDELRDHKLIDSTNAKLNASLDSNYKLLAPELAKFGLHLAKPTKSECTEGDPSLYKYACGGSALIDSDTETQTLGSPSNAANVVNSFDTFMRNNGYILEGDDFRKKRTYNPNLQANDITKISIPIAYIRNRCYVHFSIFLSDHSYNLGGFDGLDCDTTLLPVSDAK